MKWGKVILGLRAMLPNYIPACRSEFFQRIYTQKIVNSFKNKKIRPQEFLERRPSIFPWLEKKSNTITSNSSIVQYNPSRIIWVLIRLGYILWPTKISNSGPQNAVFWHFSGQKWPILREKSRKSTIC